MPISKILSRLLGGGTSGVQFREFECLECDNTFESAKQPERAQCTECLSSDVDLIGTVDRS